VQTSALSSQTADPLHGLPACTEHDPPPHVSVPLQYVPSSQDAALFTCSHPVAPHVSSVHGFPSVQPAGAHAPAQHASPLAQRFVRTQTSPSHSAV
jgi:hypothetical protein